MENVERCQVITSSIIYAHEIATITKSHDSKSVNSLSENGELR